MAALSPGYQTCSKVMNSNRIHNAGEIIAEIIA